MPELTASDVEELTAGRVPGDDVTAALLTAALAGLRRYCGWHVTPVITGHTVRLDGPGAALLTLPTLQLVELTALTENGADALPSAIWAAADGHPRRAQVANTSGWWCGGLGSVSATMSHGFTEDAAADWRLAVMRAVERSSAGTRDDPTLIRKRVVEVEYQWADTGGGAAEWGGVCDQFGLDRYRLTPEI